MTTTIGPTAVGVFDRPEDATRAVADLREHGFPDGDIAVTAPDFSQRPGATDVRPSQATHLMSAVTLIVGGLALAGWSAAFAIMFYPAYWTAGITAGLTALVAVAALVGAVVEVVRAAGEGRRAAIAADRYEPEVAAGQTVVSVRTEQRIDEAAIVLRSHGGHDVRTRHTRTPAAA
jgi:hypothetical protein